MPHCPFCANPCFPKTGDDPAFEGCKREPADKEPPCLRVDPFHAQTTSGALRDGSAPYWVEWFTSMLSEHVTTRAVRRGRLPILICKMALSALLVGWGGFALLGWRGVAAGVLAGALLALV